MDHIILGLLLMSDRTIYQLRARIDQGLNLMYSSSMGSIQAALKKLLQHGYIDYEDTLDKGMHKKVYRITESGKQAFFAWINTPIEQQAVKCPSLVKVYFMGFADPQARMASVQSYLAFLNEQHAILNLICEEAEHIEVAQDKKDILHYQLAAARYGRDLYAFNVTWFEQLLRQMRSGEI